MHQVVPPLLPGELPLAHPPEHAAVIVLEVIELRHFDPTNAGAGQTRPHEHDVVCQTMAPNRRPAPAVHAMATAPQKATRTAPRTSEAPPRRAATPPSARRSTSVTATTPGVSAAAGSSAARSAGGAAPAANDAAEATAAWIGRARVSSWIPSSSRAWAPSASCAIS